MDVTDAPDRGRGRMLQRKRLYMIKPNENDRWLTIETSGRELPELAATIRVRRDFAISREGSSRGGYCCIREVRGAA